MVKLVVRLVIGFMLLLSVSLCAVEFDEDNWDDVIDEYNERVAAGTWTLEEANSYLAGIYHMSQDEFDTITTLIQNDDKDGFEDKIKDLIEEIGSTSLQGNMAIKQMDNVMQTFVLHKKKFKKDIFTLKYSTQDWSYKKEDNEGTTSNFTPSFIFGDDLQLFLSIPLSITEDNSLEEDISSAGFDIGLRYNLNDYFRAGLHFNAIYIKDENSFLDEYGSVAGGVFLSTDIPITEFINLSLGCMYDAHLTPSSIIANIDKDIDDIDSGDVIDALSYVGAVGMNLGIVVTENFIINPYAIYYQDIDSGSNYYTPGIDFDYMLGNSLVLTLGGKTVLETDNGYEEDEIYLQVTLKF